MSEEEEIPRIRARGWMMSKSEKYARYCRFSRRGNVCPYAEEELTVMFCVACRTTKLASQQDLMIKQNKAIITLLNQIRDLLKEERCDINR